MRYNILRRIWVCVLLAVFLNIVFLSDRLRLHPALGVVLAAILCAFFVWFNIRPVSAKLDFGQKRLRILMGGRECILCAAVCLLAEAALYLSLLFPSANRAVAGGASGWILATNGVLCLLLLMVLVLNGFIRIFATSAQAGISARVLFVFLWWLPGYNIYLLKKLCADAVKEYKFAAGRAKLNQSRAHEAVCGTKYPILLVHGIFFRDWNKFNYWGRIPKELEQNGAACFYGNQKSSASVAECGAELAECIRGVVKETGCEKVNVIAHSKGGLDSRWAISRLGADKLVASLTTVNTPHRGCGYVGRIIEKMPKKALASVGRKYETLFSFLGDDSADFLGGLSGLTEAACASLNREMPDAPGVYYQSVGSRMTSRSGAAFPLSLGYGIIAPAEGDNDGLVAVSSMEWGNFLGVLSPKGKQGISHADMIYTGC